MGIKLKMTVWYTLLALLTAGLMGALLFYAAQRSALRYYSDTLEAASALARSQLEYESGNLEIDDDLDDIPDVHIALYTGSGTLIYGRTRVELPFEEVPLAACEGRVSAEYVWAYPPGIPLIVPGERVDRVFLDCCARLNRQGVRLHSTGGTMPRALRVLTAASNLSKGD